MAWFNCRIYIVYSNEISQLKISKGTVVAVLTFLGVAFAIVHAIFRFTTMFQFAFGTLACLCALRLGFYYARVKDPRAKAVAISYVRSSLIGFAFWIVDYHYCHHMRELPVNPQGHAWYDILVFLWSISAAVGLTNAL